MLTREMSCEHDKEKPGERLLTGWGKKTETLMCGMHD